MPNVRSINRGMIEQYLKNRNLKYMVDSDGDFRVEFAYSDMVGCEMTLWLILQGRRKDVYTILVMTDKAIPKADWLKAMTWCNTWNMEKRWPKAYLHVRDPESDYVGSIRLEYPLDLEQGIHQELLEDLTDSIHVAAIRFWEQTNKQGVF